MLSSAATMDATETVTPSETDEKRAIAPLREPPVGLAELAFACLREAVEPPAALVEALAGTDPVYVALRAKGRRLAEAWGQGPSQAHGLASAVHDAANAAGDRASEVDAIELCLTYDCRPTGLAPRQRRALAANIHRGVRGFVVASDQTRVVVNPLRTIATNRAHNKVLDKFFADAKLTEKDLEAGRAQAEVFEAWQFLLSRDEQGPRARPLFRGKRLVDQAEVSRAFVQDQERVLGDFLCRNVQPDGRMLYIYYPSRAIEDLKRNNMIRQFMATVALSRTARFRGDDRIFDLAEKNIRFNLRKFYKSTGKLGCIEFQNKVKLGAVALAVLSLLEHPKRAQFKRQEQRLWAMIDYLWDETGAFRTFYKPQGRNDVQNFYPGEALLAWAFLYAETRDDRLLERFMKSMRYYREWHRAQRNPAFIPWHVQAYYKVHQITEEPELADFIFEMSDWLLGMSQWHHNAYYADTLGRFHDPANPQYGPPHASATGVYLEGLIDAFELARRLGDDARREKYRLAIIRGLRSVEQLTFRDDLDMFYLPVEERERMRGGVRNTVYDNVVRIDNVQHNQMAILKILDIFEDDDFTTEA
jgi:hypothetical protein